MSARCGCCGFPWYRCEELVLALEEFDRRAAATAQWAGSGFMVVHASDAGVMLATEEGARRLDAFCAEIMSDRGGAA